MARDRHPEQPEVPAFVSPEAPANPDDPQAQAELNAQTAQVETAVPDEAPAAPPAPTFEVSLAEDHDLTVTDEEGNEEPAHEVTVAVPGLTTVDDEENVVPVEGVQLDEHNRLVVSESPVEVPAVVADNLGGLPYLQVNKVEAS